MHGFRGHGISERRRCDPGSGDGESGPHGCPSDRERISCPDGGADRRHHRITGPVAHGYPHARCDSHPVGATDGKPVTQSEPAADGRGSMHGREPRHADRGHAHDRY